MRHEAFIASFNFGYKTGRMFKCPVIKGETVGFKAEIENVGTYEDTFNVTLYMNNTIIANSSFTLPPGETGVVEWTRTPKDVSLLAQSGLFNVTLKVSVFNVTNASVTTQTAWLKIIEPPILNITISPETPLVNQTVTIDASQSHHQDPNGTITLYSWKISDPEGVIKLSEQGSNLTTINFKFTIEGDWTIELTVIDNFGLTYDPNREKTEPYRKEFSVVVAGGEEAGAGIPEWLIALIAAIVIIVVIAVIVVLRKRRKAVVPEIPET